VSAEEAKRYAKEMKFVAYVECSARNGVGIEKVASLI
jgi:translation initiation factor IF-2